MSTERAPDPTSPAVRATLDAAVREYRSDARLRYVVDAVCRALAVDPGSLNDAGLARLVAPILHFRSGVLADTVEVVEDATRTHGRPELGPWSCYCDSGGVNCGIVHRTRDSAVAHLKLSNARGHGRFETRERPR